MFKQVKYHWFWISMGLACMLLSLLSCRTLPENLGLLPAAPTPHYTPMSGSAYIAPIWGNEGVLWNRPKPPRVATANVLSGTLVHIQEAVWYYSKTKYHEVGCYTYYVQVPGTEIAGWTTGQERLTQERGKSVPIEYWCDSQGQPTPTPPYAPLTGSVYVNVGQGYGVALSPEWDPREHNDIIMFAHGLQVDILDKPRWMHYEATEKFPETLCYVYHVILPAARVMGKLPEDVLTQDLTETPERRCFPGQVPPTVFQIAPTPPEGFEIFFPE